MVKQSRSPSILLTRPQLQSERFADLLHAQCPDARFIYAPLLKPQFLNCVVAPRAFSAVVFTSETAVEGLMRRPDLGRMVDGPLAYCVGDRTASAARALGFTALSAKGGVNQLFDLISAQKPKGPLLYLRGVEAIGELTNRLVSAGIETVEAIIYKQTPEPLGEEALRFLRSDQPVIIPVFSPRTAAVFIAEYQRCAGFAPLYLAAMSANVARVLADCPHVALEVSERPDADAMAEVVLRLCTLARNA